MELANFWIEIQNKKSGHKMLSCKIEGKHYVGFVVEKEDKRENGETYLKEIANMRPCNWEGCQTCHPDSMLI